MRSILFILLLISAASGQKTECVQYVQKLINDILDFNIESIPLPSLMYSGITPNNPGQMQQCGDSNYSYYLVFIKNITTMTQSFRGLCMPNQCTASDIEIALQFLHCRVYSTNELKITDRISAIGGIIIIVWLVVLIVFSCFISIKQPIINQYLVSERSQTDSASISADQSTEGQSQFRKNNLNIFNYYQGYRKLFKLSNKKNYFSIILYLSVISFAVSTEFSYRQNIAENTTETFQTLNSIWGIFICNIQITLHSIIFALGFKLALSLHEVKNFRSVGRLFFDSILKKWIFIILSSLLIYSIMSYLVNKPLSKVWRDNNGKDCPLYIWQTWFVFRNLQLDCKICLPWFTLLQADLLFTILSAPFIIIFKVSKKMGYFLIFMLMLTSILISYAILKNQGIIFEPAKLMNQQKQYFIDYQGNAFVRMGAYFLGLFFGLLISEGMQKTKNKNNSFQSSFYKLVTKKQLLQILLILLGIGLMTFCYLLIYPFLDIENQNKQPFYYLIFTPLGFVFGLGLFMIPFYWQGESALAKVGSSVLGWQGWTHLDRISISFYLLSPMVIGYSTYSSQNSIYYDIQTVGMYLLGDIFTIYFLSILVTASFENQLTPLVSWLQVQLLGQESQFTAILIQQL